MTRDTPSRVLVVAYDFPPHAAIGTMRTLRVVRRLHADGWAVTVLTGDPRSYLLSTPVDRALLDQVPPGVQVVRAGALRAWDRLTTRLASVVRGTPSGPAGESGHAGSDATDGPNAGSRARVLAPVERVKRVVDRALAIPDRELGWLLPALGKGLIGHLFSTRPDVIYSSSPPWTGQIVAAGLTRVLGCPWVADFRDPWARAPWREDRPPFALRAAARLERSVILRADRVVFVAKANRDDFAAHYGPETARKFHVVPNGCDRAEFEGLAPEPSADGRFVLLHAGSLYAGRTPLPVLNALSTAVTRGLINPERFTLRFLGTNGLQSVDAPAACRTLGIERLVEFVPRVERRESLRQMLSASALLLLQPGHAVSVPGKLYEYFATGRPILAIAEEGETANLVRRSGVGVSVSPDAEAAIVDGLAAVMQMARARVDPPPLELFDGNHGASRIAALLESVVYRRAAPAAHPSEAEPSDWGA